MGNFVTWCELNHLQLNVTKTKDLTVDLRRAETPVTPVSIHGVPVDTVEEYLTLIISWTGLETQRWSIKKAKADSFS